MTNLQEQAYFFYHVNAVFDNEVYQQMEQFVHHRKTTRLKHCMFVAYISYKMGKYLGLDCDYKSLIRGAMLHDFYLYHRDKSENEQQFHNFTHAKAALENAEEHFDLTDREKDIIKKHMWPLNIKLPRYKESYLVWLADKYCSMAEVSARLFRRRKTTSDKLPAVVSYYK